MCIALSDMGWFWPQMFYSHIHWSPQTRKGHFSKSHFCSNSISIVRFQWTECVCAVNWPYLFLFFELHLIFSVWGSNKCRLKRDECQTFCFLLLHKMLPTLQMQWKVKVNSVQTCKSLNYDNEKQKKKRRNQWGKWGWTKSSISYMCRWVPNKLIYVCFICIWLINDFTKRRLFNTKLNFVRQSLLCLFRCFQYVYLFYAVFFLSQIALHLRNFFIYFLLIDLKAEKYR